MKLTKKPIVGYCLLAVLIFAIALQQASADLAVMQTAYVQDGSYANSIVSGSTLEVADRGTNYDRKAYLGYNLSGALAYAGQGFSNTSLALTMASMPVYPSGTGVVAVNVYGITGAVNSWSSGSLTWNNAPQNDTSSPGGTLAAGTTYLGTININAGSVVGGQVFTLSGAALDNYLNWAAGNLGDFYSTGVTSLSSPTVILTTSSSNLPIAQFVMTGTISYTPVQLPLVVYPMPSSEVVPANQMDYNVWVKQASDPDSCYVQVGVYKSWMFDYLYNTTTIAGRPVSPESFCSFDASTPVTVKVQMLSGLSNDPNPVNTNSVTIRPLSSGITATPSNGVFTFTVNTQPCQLSIEPGGGSNPRHPLQLFVNALDTDPLAVNPPTASGNGICVLQPGDHGTIDMSQSPYSAYTTLYFAPGTHSANVLLQSNTHVYVAGGAVVEAEVLPPPGYPGGCTINSYSGGIEYGIQNYSGSIILSALFAGGTSTSHIVINGRGVLSGRNAMAAQWPAGSGNTGPMPQRATFFNVQGDNYVSISDLIVRESGSAGAMMNCTSYSTVNNLKILQHYSQTDGVIVAYGQDDTVENCYSNTGDEGFEIKGWGNCPTQNVTFSNCVIWNHIGIALGQTEEATQPMSNVTYSGCTVIHDDSSGYHSGVIGVNLEGTASLSNFTFTNITVEDSIDPGRATIGVMNNWSGWGLQVPGHPYQAPGYPLTTDGTTPRGPISNVAFNNINVINAADTDVIIASADPVVPTVSNITLNNVSINGSPLSGLNDPRIHYVNVYAGLLGQYLSDGIFSQECDPQVNFAWTATPGDSAVWTGTVTPSYSETYTFSTQTSGQVRLWVNNQPLINDRTSHSIVTDSGTIALTAGTPYSIRLEYATTGTAATALLQWTSPSQANQVIPTSSLIPAVNDGGLNVVYYTNTDFTGVISDDCDTTVNHYLWNGSPPATGIPGNAFSARWQGLITPTVTGVYNFNTWKIGAVTMTIDNTPIISTPYQNFSTDNISENITLTAGVSYWVDIDYYNNTDNAKLQLYWTPPGGSNVLVPSNVLSH